MDNIMADVIKRGTGVRARVLGREDISGKTGTTNESHDTWFNGFNQNIEATVWVGFDQEQSLGEGEEGSSVAVPVWVRLMRDGARRPARHAAARCRRDYWSVASTHRLDFWHAGQRCRRDQRVFPVGQIAGVGQLGQQSVQQRQRAALFSHATPQFTAQRQPAPGHRAGSRARHGRAWHPGFPHREAQGRRTLRRHRGRRAAEQYRSGNLAGRVPAAVRGRHARCDAARATPRRVARDALARGVFTAPGRTGADRHRDRAQRRAAAPVCRSARVGGAEPARPRRRARRRRAPPATRCRALPGVSFGAVRDRLAHDRRDGVSGGWNSAGADQPGRRQADAKSGCRRTRGVARQPARQPLAEYA